MTQTSDAARAYANAHADRFLEELFELIRIPSLSADPAHAGDVRAAAEWLAEHLEAIGADNVAVMETAGHPVVYGEWLDRGAGQTDGAGLRPLRRRAGTRWKMAGRRRPFEPVVKDGKIYARGATDDKGQLFIHVKAFEVLPADGGGAPGQREISAGRRGRGLVAKSPPIHRIAPRPARGRRLRHQRLVDARIEEPAITHSLRGMTYIEVEVQGPRDDLHSGFFGGATHNPALALVQILASSTTRTTRSPCPVSTTMSCRSPTAERDMIAKTAVHRGAIQNRDRRAGGLG